jgi:hypothetical protein
MQNPTRAKIKTDDKPEIINPNAVSVQPFFLLINTNHGAIAPPVIDLDIFRGGDGCLGVDLDMAEPCSYAVCTDFLSIF